MTKKRCIRAVLGFALGISLLASASWKTEAKEEVKLQIGEAVEEENQVKIPISISGGKNVAGLDLNVVYDPGELHYAGVEQGGALPASGVCDINHVAKESSVHFVYASLDGIGKDGEIMTLTFDVLDDTVKEHTVDIHVKKVLDEDIEELAYSVVGGRSLEPKDATYGTAGPTGTQSEGTADADDSQEGNSQTGNSQTGDVPETEGKSEGSGNSRSVSQQKAIASAVSDKASKVNAKVQEEKRETAAQNAAYLILAAAVVAALAGCIYMRRKKKR